MLGWGEVRSENFVNLGGGGCLVVWGLVSHTMDLGVLLCGEVHGLW